MTNSGMKCACNEWDACDAWHAMEDFVYEFGFLPFPPYTKYHKIFNRMPAELLGVIQKEYDPLRLFTLYRRDDPPQYATPPTNHTTKYKKLIDDFPDPCPSHDKSAWAAFCPR